MYTARAPFYQTHSAATVTSVSQRLQGFFLLRRTLTTLLKHNRQKNGKREIRARWASNVRRRTSIGRVTDMRNCMTMPSFVVLSFQFLDDAETFIVLPNRKAKPRVLNSLRPIDAPLRNIGSDDLFF